MLQMVSVFNGALEKDIVQIATRSTIVSWGQRTEGKASVLECYAWGSKQGNSMGKGPGAGRRKASQYNWR